MRNFINAQVPKFVTLGAWLRFFFGSDAADLSGLVDSSGNKANARRNLELQLPEKVLDTSIGLNCFHLDIYPARKS